MRKGLCSFALAGLATAAMTGVAAAQISVLDDPLHGYCAGAGQCQDLMTGNSPTSNNPPVNFGFTASSGPLTGDFLIDILVPNSETQIASFSITGTLSGIATQAGTGAWTGGAQGKQTLADFLGLVNASPDNKIDAYLPATTALGGVASSATGFFVYQADFGSQTLLGPSSPNVNPLENLGETLGLGSYIVGFLNVGTANAPDWIATANSGAIFETGNGSGPGGGPGGSPGGTPVPEPSTLLILGAGLVGLGLVFRRKLIA